MTTYVYDNEEVKLTGRTAIREFQQVPNKPKVKQELVEITPADPDNGSWKKWVQRGVLFEVIE
jgi:hypothetical protein